MTCIVGLVENGQVYIGADSACVSDHFSYSRKSPKLFRLRHTDGDTIIGVAGSAREAQLIGYRLEAPRPLSVVHLTSYMVREFADAVRSALRDGGALKSDKGVDEMEATLMVGIRGRLFTVYQDFQVEEAGVNYHAIGSGREPAVGSLFTTAGYVLDPHSRVQMALMAAEAYISTVKSPFLVEVL